MNPLCVQSRVGSAPGQLVSTAMPRGTGLIWTISRRRDGSFVMHTFAPPSTRLDLNQQKLTHISAQNGSSVSCWRVERGFLKFERVGLERSSASSSFMNPKSGMLL